MCVLDLGRVTRGWASLFFSGLVWSAVRGGCLALVTLRRFVRQTDGGCCSLVCPKTGGGQVVSETAGMVLLAGVGSGRKRRAHRWGAPTRSFRRKRRR